MNVKTSAYIKLARFHALDHVDPDDRVPAHYYLLVVLAQVQLLPRGDVVEVHLNKRIRIDKR